VLNGHGLRLHVQTRQALAESAARAMFQALMQTLKECNGDWRRDPEADRFPAPYAPVVEIGATVPLEDLRAVASAGIAEPTTRRWKPILKRPLAAAGKADFSRLTTSDAERRRDATPAEGRVSPPTFARHDLAAVRLARLGMREAVGRRRRACREFGACACG
jgi:hypothetical protein